MIRYQVNSRRKHFYPCQHCPLVFINSEAHRNHCTLSHPDLTCVNIQYESDSLEGEEDPLEDFRNNNMINSFRSENSFYNNNFINQNELLETFPLLNNTTNNDGQTDNYNLIQINNNQAQNSESYLDVAQFNTNNSNNIHAQLQPLPNDKLEKKTTPSLVLQPILLAQPPPATSLILQTNAPNVPVNCTNSQFEPQPVGILISQNTQTKNKKRFKCDFCPKAFSTTYSKRRHEQTHQESSKNTKNNDSVNKNEPLMQMVEIVEGPMETFITKMPDIKVLTALPSQTDNVVAKAEKVKKSVQCGKCDKTFATQYNKRRHEEMVHAESNTSQRTTAKYQCSSCDKVFSSIYNKTRHENVHKPIAERLKHICHYCHKGFTTPFILKSHIEKIHFNRI